MGKIATMPKYQTAKLFAETVYNLKLLAALRGETMAQVADEVIRKDLQYWQDKMRREELEKKGEREEP